MKFTYVLVLAFGSGWSTVTAQSAHFSGAQSSGNFGSVNVGSSSSTLSLPFTFDSGGKLGSIRVVTQGALGLDFNDAGTGTCQAGTDYTAGQTCTIDAIFTPKFAGVRYGAALLIDGNGNAIATGYVHGSGVGPQMGFSTGSNSTIASGFIAPWGEVVDGNGDVYVVDNGSSTLQEVVAVNGRFPPSPTILPLMFLPNAFGVALDGAGNLFVTDYVNGTISEILAGSAGISNSSIMKTVANGLSYPWAPAVDANGDLFVTNQGDGTVREIIAVNGSIPPSPPIQLVAGGFNQPSFLTLDGSNNIFVSDSGNDVVKEILAVNGSIPPSPSITTVATGLNGSVGLATDAAGDLFIANAAYNEIDEYLAVNGLLQASSQVIRMTGGFNEPHVVALSGNGNLFVLDTGNGGLVEFDRADPPSLTFASTSVGTTSADSPQNVTLVNSGNLNLTFPIPSSGTNPSIPSSYMLDSGSTSDCPLLTSSATDPGNLAPGATCVLRLSFTPLSGGLNTGSLTLTDNSLNPGSSNFASQAITLIGVGNSFAVSASPVTLSIVQGKSGTTSVAVTDFGVWTTKVKLAISGLPSGTSAQFSPDQVTSSSSLALSVGGNTPIGTYTLQITGTSNNLTQSTTVILTVLPRKS